MNKLLLLLCIAPLSLFAQVSIKGKVVNQSSGNAVPLASVFLSNTGVGNKTEKDGSFKLSNIKNGRYQLVVTCIGFSPLQQTLTVSGNDINLPNIKLNPKVAQLKEVKVKFEKKSDRDMYMRIFVKAFLGNDYNATQCTITNPDIIDFSYSKKKGLLRASTDDFMIIENKALGYRIKYLLESFVTNVDNDEEHTMNYVGVSAFEPMQGDEQQQSKWINKREKAYRGSPMHFFRSCIADAVSENEFTVRATIIPEFIPKDSVIMRKIAYFRNTAAKSKENTDSLAYWNTVYWAAKNRVSSIEKVLRLNEYIKLTNEKGIYAFSSKSKGLLINYKNKLNLISTGSTYVTFPKPDAFFDSNGVIFTPANILFEGYWPQLRVGDQLPVDYEPLQYERPPDAPQTVQESGE